MSRIITVLCFSICFNSCITNTNKQEIEKSTEVVTQLNLEILEVYTSFDKPFLDILDSIPTIEGFANISELDYSSYQPIVFGIAKSDSSRDEILLEVIKYIPEEENVIPMWTNKKVENRMLGSSHYELYLTKESDQTFEIDINNTITANKELNYYDNTPNLVIELDQPTAIKWNELTTKAANSGNRNIAITDGNDILSCPRVMAPILGNKITLPYK